MDYDTKAAEEYGEIRAELERKEKTIGQMYMLVAAHAKSGNHIVITNYMREFECVEGLTVEDWV